MATKDTANPQEHTSSATYPDEPSDLSAREELDAMLTDEPSPAPSADAEVADEELADGERSTASVVPPPPPPAAAAEGDAAAVEQEEDDETLAAYDEDDGQDEQEEPHERRGWFGGRRMRNTGAVFTSAVTHLLLLIALAMWLLPEASPEIRTVMLNSVPAEEQAREAPVIHQPVQATTAVTALTSAPSPMSTTAGGASGLVGTPALDQKLVRQLATAGAELNISHPLEGAPEAMQLIEATPDGALGDPHAIVADYDDAFDRLTQEILWMLSKSKVLVVWCFDQSESMKDDQQEIRARIRRVYSELGLVGRTSNESLTTAVTSYGGRYLRHTRKPTNKVEEIQAAMDTVPIDPSGQEMMCQAVTLSITQHLDYAKGSKRQIALILVTDESGEREGNQQLLEQAIAAARAAKCRIFVLGREAVFGYPFAHMKWRHPQTGHVHWLPIDRGPETAFVEQLQTDGFRRRYDAHPSGFGPYEQTRMVRESGGIFFMLPSLETNLVRGEKRIYELEAMRAYFPDLDPRGQQLAERDASMLRSALWKIINDLNPYTKEVAEVMEVRYQFSSDPARFLTQVRTEQAKAKLYLGYLAAAEKALGEIVRYRQQEASPRWQANYDLVHAQLVAYIARTYEYGAYLEVFLAEPKIVPLEKPNFRRLSHWDIQHSKNTVAGELTAPYIERSKAMFDQVIATHPGTPWAARAQWELDRGFGFELHERYSYYGPRTPSTPTTVTIPIPKL